MLFPGASANVWAIHDGFGCMEKMSGILSSMQGGVPKVMGGLSWKVGWMIHAKP